MITTRTLTRWVLAELIGTAILTMALAVMITETQSGLTNLNFITLFLPFGAGITLFVIVTLFGPVGGTHVNPMITLGHMLFRKMEWKQGVVYLISQVVGAYIGIALTHLLLGTGHVVPSTTMTTPGVLGEFIGTFLLSFAFMNITLKKVESSMAALVAGATLTLGTTLALSSGAGLLNPAVALAFGAYGWMYLAIPFLGGLGGAALAVIFDEEDDDLVPTKK